MTMTKPWDAIGMSRAGWYRHGKPDAKTRRMTVKQIAAALGCGVRTIERDLAERRNEMREVVARLRALGCEVTPEIAVEIWQSHKAANGRDRETRIAETTRIILEGVSQKSATVAER
jgi:hypothetical protein